MPRRRRASKRRDVPAQNEAAQNGQTGRRSTAHTSPPSREGIDDWRPERPSVPVPDDGPHRGKIAAIALHRVVPGADRPEEGGTSMMIGFPKIGASLFCSRASLPGVGKLRVPIPGTARPRRLTTTPQGKIAFAWCRFRNFSLYPGNFPHAAPSPRIRLGRGPIAI